MEEIWKDINEYEGYYQVSNLGRVKSLARKIPRIDGKINVRRDLIRCLSNDNKGYHNIGLRKKGTYKFKKVHRLVAEAFIPNPKCKKYVNHINEIKTDNRVDNLEWVSFEENVNHGTRNKRISIAKSIPVKCTRISDGLVKVYSSIKSVENDGFNKREVSKCLKNKDSQHKGFKWSKVNDPR